MILRSPLALLALALLASQAAGASDGGAPWFQETIAFKGAAIFAFIDSDIKYKGQEIDLEDDLDLDDFSVLPSLDLRWRFTRNKKHRLEASYFSILRSDSRTLDFDLELPGEDETIPVGARLDTDLNVHIATLTYGYSFLHRERMEFGFFAGLDFIVADAKVSGTCQIGNVPFECDDDLIEEGFNIPFPTAGLYFDWAFAEKLALMTRFQYFGLKFEGIHGQLFRGKVRLQHRTFRHVDLFVGYDVLGANVDFDSSSFEWLGLVYHGPMLGLVLRF
jgi:hypothetical protein